MVDSPQEKPGEKVDQQQPSEQSGFSLAESARAFAYSAIQKPVTGVSQWVDRTSGTHLTESTQFIDQPKEAAFGTFQWHVDQVASGAGAFVPYVAAMTITRGTLKTVGAEGAVKFAGSQAGTAASIYRTGEAATAGFVNGMLFEPMNNKDTFVSDHLKQGIAGGINFGTMRALSNQISKFTGASAVEASWFNRAGTTAIAGVGGGIASSIADSAMTGQQLDLKDVAKTAYQSAFTGFALGAGADHFLRLHQPKSSFPEVQKYVAGNPYGHSGLSNHYLSWLHSRSTSGLIGLGAEAALRRNIPTRMLWDTTAVNRVELVAEMEKRGDSFFTKPSTVQDIHDVFESQTNLEELQEKFYKASDEFYDSPKDGPNWWEDGAEEWAKARDSSPTSMNYKRAEQELDDAVARRTSDLQDSLNQFLQKHNLPQIELKSSDDLGRFSGTYSAGGVVSMDTRLLEGGKLHPVTVEVATHELTHLRQDVLFVRKIADELNIGKNATPEQIQRLRAEYDEHWRLDVDLSDVEHLRKKDSLINDEQRNQFLGNVLRLRDGNRLTESELKDVTPEDAAEQKIAETIVAMVKPSQNFVQMFTDDGVPNISFDQMFHDIVHDPEKFKTDWGFSKIPKSLSKYAAEHLDPNYDANAEHDSSNDKYKFSEHQDEWNSGFRPHFIIKQLSLYLKMMKYQMQLGYGYYSDPGEQTAHPTGKLSGWAYQLRDENF
ncbi:MAG TPA: hypothetical protein V6C76_07275 [Drouetiella sp.]